ncbi:unnamed protein product, partial [Mesorhabditis belari]
MNIVHYAITWSPTIDAVATICCLKSYRRAFLETIFNIRPATKPEVWQLKNGNGQFAKTSKRETCFARRISADEKANGTPHEGLAPDYQIFRSETPNIMVQPIEMPGEQADHPSPTPLEPRTLSARNLDEDSL